jgi:acyl-CoA thioesterase-1
MARKILLAVATLGAAGCQADDRPGAPPERATPRADTRASERVVLALGTSLTAGYGLAAAQAYPALLQQRIDEEGLDFAVVNAGESGSTSAGGLGRLDWHLRRPLAVLLLELGANDGLRGQDVAALERNLQAIIDRAKEAHPDVAVIIAGMEAPPNLGSRYTEEFRSVFPRLARRNDAALIPFLLEGVAGVPDLNQLDGIHPTAEGQQMVAETVWRVLDPLLQQVTRQVPARTRSAR